MLGDYAALRKNYLAAEYRADAAAQAVVATVHCEAEADRADPVAETRWLEQQRLRHGFPTGIVVWAAFGDPRCAAQIEAHLAASTRVRGVRCKPALQTPAAGGFADPAWLHGLVLLQKYGLSWDLRVPWSSLSAAAEIVARHPALPVVLNHCGLPLQRDAEALRLWRTGMRALAALPNVSVKLSELGLAARAWSEADNLSILREVLGLFGPGRCLFASNFPVARMRVGFDRWCAAVAAALDGYGPADRHAVFAGNAMAFYRLPQSPPGLGGPLL